MIKRGIFAWLVLILFLVGCAQKESQKTPSLADEEAPFKEEKTEFPLIETEQEKATEISEPTASEAMEKQNEDRVEDKLPSLINGKTVGRRFQEAIEKLHTPESAAYIRENFPDIELVYTDHGEPYMPKEILPFRYYYSKEADATFNICNVELTVFICRGKLEKLIQDEDYDSGRCTVTSLYQPLIGGKFG